MDMILLLVVEACQDTSMFLMSFFFTLQNDITKSYNNSVTRHGWNIIMME